MGAQPSNGLLRGISWLKDQCSGTAILGAAAMGLFIMALATSYFCAARAHRNAVREARRDEVESLANLLTQSCEILLADNELSAARRIVSQSARDHGLSTLRITLPDGQVLADADPRGITLMELPEPWIGKAPPQTVGTVRSDVLSFPMAVPGHGPAMLEVTAPPMSPGTFFMDVQAGAGITAGLGLVALLGLYHLARTRTRGVLAVCDALRDYQGGETSFESLKVNGQWGPAAQAWNAVVHHKAAEAQAAVEESALQLLRERRSEHGSLNAACDALSQGLILVGEDLRARYVNGAAAVLLQVDKEKLQQEDVTDLLPDHRVVQAVRESTGNATRGRTVVEIQRGESLEAAVLRFVVRPIRRGDSGAAMVVIEDITQQRVAEKARHLFVAQATHELRTPLTNICLYAETGLDEGENDPAVRLNSLNVINQEARRLERMVSDMLSVAEMEAGSLRLRRDDVRLDELLAQLRADHEASAKEKGIEMSFQLPPKLPVLQGDRDKIALGLHNLLGNALKYTPEGGKIAVKVSTEARKLLVEVTDTGIGISPEECEHVFDKFYRSQDHRVDKVTGTGLGLAIAREVIRLHGGEITVQSQLDKGSTFALSLPVPSEAS